MKELKDNTFDELVEARANDALCQLMESGGKGFKSSIYMAMELAIRWYEETHDNS